MKKALAVLLAAVMCCTLLSACGQPETTDPTEGTEGTQTETNAADLVYAVEAGSRQLAGILRQETWFVLSKESTLAEAGYLCWTPSLTFSSVTDPTRTYETLVRAGEQQGSALRVLVHSQSAGGALAGVLGQLAQDGDTFLPARETSY